MFIHPKIRQLQERFNKIYLEFEVENDVVCLINLDIYLTNERINKNQSYKELITDVLKKSNEEICDFIYNHFNVSKRLD
jgi:MinD-like ATPase involved in chromosome partitioning or flagellar assembly